VALHRHLALRHLARMHHSVRIRAWTIELSTTGAAAGPKGAVEPAPKDCRCPPSLFSPSARDVRVASTRSLRRRFRPD
jgi:hypothetical protein